MTAPIKDVSKIQNILDLTIDEQIEKCGLEINKVYNEDCMIGMQRIKDKSIDMILFIY
jgi:DNA-binding Lrp family transcriptional regulator